MPIIFLILFLQLMFVHAMRKDVKMGKIDLLLTLMS